MRRILNKIETRHLNLIELLFYSDLSTMEEVEAQKQLGISNRILKEDIYAINEKYSFFEIKVIDGKLVISFRDNYSMDYIYQQIYKGSNGFKLLEYLFFKGQASTEDLVNHLYLSHSTVYRTILSIVPILEEEFGFTIQSNPYQLEGIENNIRYFFLKYMTEAYNTFEWPFENLDKDRLEEMCLFLHKLTPYELDYLNLRNFVFEVAINITRDSHGFSNPVDQASTETVQAVLNQIIPENSQLYEEFNDKFGQEFSAEYISTIASVYVNGHFFYSYADLEKYLQSDDHSQQAVAFLSESLDELVEKHEIALNNKEELILELYNTISLESRTNNQTYLLFPRFDNLRKYMEKTFPNFHQDVEKYLKTYLSLLLENYPTGLLDALLFSFYTYWEELFIHLEKRILPIKTLVLSNFNQYHAKFVTDMLNMNFSKQLDLQLWDELILTKSQIENSDYDLIISTFTMKPIHNKYCFSFSNIPTNDHIMDLNVLISKIRKNQL